eukprot:6466561-Amphidinium_carterae.1
MDYEVIRTQMRRLLYDFSKAGPKRVVGKGVYLADSHMADREEPEIASILQEMAGDSEVSEDDAQEILLAYSEARAKAHQKRMGRGFYKPSSSASSLGTGSTGAPTPWNRSNNTNNSSSNNPMTSGSQGSAGGARDRDIAALKARTKCRKCGKLGHWARECRSKPASSVNYAEGSPEANILFGATMGAAAVASETDAGQAFPSHGAYFTRSHDVYMRPYTFADRGLSQDFHSIRPTGFRCGSVTSQSIGSLSRSCVVSGLEISSWSEDSEKSVTVTCLRNAIVTRPRKSALVCIVAATVSTHASLLESHLSWVQQLAWIQDALRQANRCRFRFGADFAVESTESVSIPVCFGQRFGVVNASVVPGATPLLLSLPLLRALQSVLDCAEEKMEFRKLGVVVPLHVVQGHLAVDLWGNLTKQMCQDHQSPTVMCSEFAIYWGSRCEAERLKAVSVGNEEDSQNGRTDGGRRTEENVAERCAGRAQGHDQTARTECGAGMEGTVHSLARKQEREEGRTARAFSSSGCRDSVGKRSDKDCLQAGGGTWQVQHRCRESHCEGTLTDGNGIHGLVDDPVCGALRASGCNVGQ